MHELVGLAIGLVLGLVIGWVYMNNLSDATLIQIVKDRRARRYLEEQARGRASEEVDRELDSPPGA